MACNHTRSASKPYCDVCDPLHEWLPIHNRKMVSRERERIIALVREMPRVAHDGLVNAEQLIALIKGENSE